MLIMITHPHTIAKHIVLRTVWYFSNEELDTRTLRGNCVQSNLKPFNLDSHSQKIDWIILEYLDIRYWLGWQSWILSRKMLNIVVSVNRHGISENCDVISYHDHTPTHNRNTSYCSPFCHFFISVLSTLKELGKLGTNLSLLFSLPNIDWWSISIWIMDIG